MDLNGSVIGDIFGELPININYVSLINETSDPGYIDIMGFMNSFLNFWETGTGRDDICATPDTDGNNFNGGDGIIAAWNQSLKGLVNNTREIKRNGKSHLDETKDLTGILDALNIPVLSIKVHCPVDLEIVDPDGNNIKKNLTEIWGAVYREVYLSATEKEDYVEIPLPLPGEYKINVLPEPSAQPNMKLHVRS